ncbi:MAG: response regulator [Gammaproteobacteria bacterium]
MYRIMVVDDEQNILSAMKRMLKKEQEWQAEFFDSGPEALERLNGHDFELIMSDYRMPGMDGVQFLKESKKIQPEAMRIILSGYTDLDALMGAINEAEIFRFISKPWQDYDLKMTLTQALAHRKVLVDNRKLADQVRAQQTELDNRKAALDKLRSTNPVLVDVHWDDDGSIILEE